WASPGTSPAWPYSWPRTIRRLCVGNASWSMAAEMPSSTKGDKAMGKTIAEKVLARASGKSDVKPGDIVTAKVDLNYTVESGFVQTLNKIVEAGLPDGLPKIANPDNVAVMTGDHVGCHGT